MSEQVARDWTEFEGKPVFLQLGFALVMVARSGDDVGQVTLDPGGGKPTVLAQMPHLPCLFEKDCGVEVRVSYTSPGAGGSKVTARLPKAAIVAISTAEAKRVLTVGSRLGSVEAVALPHVLVGVRGFPGLGPLGPGQRVA